MQYRNIIYYNKILTSNNDVDEIRGTILLNNVSVTNSSLTTQSLDHGNIIQVTRIVRG